MQTAAISVRCNGPMGDEKEMKIYSFGEETKPAILLLPGTCCHWKRNFGHVIPLLQEHFYVLCASYDGFDETEDSTFPNMLIETESWKTISRKISAVSSLRHMAVLWAAPLWDLWCSAKKSISGTESSEAPIWIRAAALEPGRWRKL